MKGTDVFSGLTWGDLSRYRIRHDQTIHKEKAGALDERIRQMLRLERNYDWANKALDFCNREVTAASAEVTKYSREFPQLELIRKEALQLIQQRKDQEADAIRRAALSADETIASLAAAARSSYWCDEVKKFDDEVRAMPRQIRVLMKKLDLLQQLLDEVALLRKTEQVERDIRNLLESKKKDESWLAAAEKYVLSKAKNKDVSLVRDQKLLKDLTAEYWRVRREPVVKKYEDMLGLIGREQYKQETVRRQFHSLDGELKSLDFGMEMYIKDFQSSWQKAGEKVRQEEHRVEKEQEARRIEAKHKANRDELRNYLECLARVEAGGAVHEFVRDKFDSLDRTVNKLKFDPEEYCSGFRGRWSSARLSVAREHGKAAELAQKARQEAAIRAAQELQNRRQNLAAQELRDGARSFVIFVLSVLGCMTATFFGVNFAAGMDSWWAASLMMAFGALIYICAANVNEDSIYEFPHILMQILYYAASILILIFFDQSIISMIVSAALVAVLFNVYPRFVPFNLKPVIRWGKVVCILVSGAVLAIGLGDLFPSMVAQAAGNAAWLCPALILAFSGSTGFAIWAKVDGQRKTLCAILCALALGAAVLAHAFGIYSEIYGQDSVGTMAVLGIVSILIVPIVFFCRRDRY